MAPKRAKWRLNAPATAELDVVNVPRFQLKDYGKVDGGFSYRPPSNWSQSKADLPTSREEPLLEEQKKAWVAQIVAHLSERAKDRLKRFYVLHPAEVDDVRVHEAMMREFFREVRGENCTDRNTGIEYLTPDFDNMEDAEKDFRETLASYPYPFYKPPSSKNRPPAQPEDEGGEGDEEEEDEEWLDEEEVEARKQDDEDPEILALPEEERANAKKIRKKARKDEKAEKERIEAIEEARRKEIDAELAKKEARKKARVKARNRRNWLNSNRQWWERPMGGRRSKWVGIKFLGAGGNGMAGLVSQYLK